MDKKRKQPYRKLRKFTTLQDENQKLAKKLAEDLRLQFRQSIHKYVSKKIRTNELVNLSLTTGTIFMYELMKTFDEISYNPLDMPATFIAIHQLFLKKYREERDVKRQKHLGTN